MYELNFVFDKKCSGVLWGKMHLTQIPSPPYYAHLSVKIWLL